MHVQTVYLYVVSYYPLMWWECISCCYENSVSVIFSYGHFKLKALSKLEIKVLVAYNNVSKSIQCERNFPSGLRRSPGEGKGNPLQYACLENPWTEKPGGLQSMGS